MDSSIKVGSKVYKLRFRLPDRELIEDKASGSTPRALLEIMVSGRIHDQAVVVYAGIRGADRDTKVTPRGLIEEFQRHNERGNGSDYYTDIVVPVYVQVAEAKLLGDVNMPEFKRQIGFREEGKDEGETAGPEAVKAQE